MGTERRRLLLLAAVAVMLVGVVAWALTGTSGVSTPASAGRIAPGKFTPIEQDSRPTTAPDVHLEALNGERPIPIQANRNLFRFKPAPAPPPPPPRVVQPVEARPVPSPPPGVPPPPPIPLKFIGIVQASQGTTRIAALVDATGHPYHGAEGEVVAGQYRVLKISPESIEMAYLDGRGRQVIRLSGS